MNTDFRIEVGFFDHHKTSALIDSLGLEAAWALLRLWEFATINKPSGDLGRMTDDEISRAAKYKGDTQKLVSELRRLGWLDRARRGAHGTLLHDWSEHQPYVVGAPARREKARKAAEARHSRSPNKDARSKADSMLRASYEHAQSNAPSFLPSYPQRETPERARDPQATSKPALPLPDSGTTPIRKEPRTTDPAAIENYRKRREALEQQLRAKHPNMGQGELLALVTAQLKLEDART